MDGAAEGVEGGEEGGAEGVLLEGGDVGEEAEGDLGAVGKLFEPRKTLEVTGAFVAVGLEEEGGVGVVEDNEGLSWPTRKRTVGW